MSELHDLVNTIERLNLTRLELRSQLTEARKGYLNAIGAVEAEHALTKNQLAASEARVCELREAINYLFTPGPGIAVPVKHENPMMPMDKTWNEKIGRLEAALTHTSSHYAGLVVVKRQELEALQKDRERLDWLWNAGGRKIFTTDELLKAGTGRATIDAARDATGEGKS